MKHVTFKNLFLQNFLSVGNIPLEIDLSQSGIFAITGINKDKGEGESNGVGKSVIFDGLFFCCFGETLRDIKKEEIVNNINKKKCLCRLELDIEEGGVTKTFIIERGIGPSFCKLYEDRVSEDTDKSLSTIPATTEEIRKKLNTTPSLFRHLITMSLNSTAPFMALKKNEKREFIEGIVKIEVLKSMNKIAKDRNTEVTKEYEINRQAVLTCNEAIVRLTESKRVSDDNALKQVQDYTQKINRSNDSVEDLKKLLKGVDILKLNELTTKLDELKKQESGLQHDKFQAGTTVKSLEQQKQSLEKDLQDAIHRRDDAIVRYKGALGAVPTFSRETSFEDKKTLFSNFSDELQKSIQAKSLRQGEINVEVRNAKQAIFDLNKFGNMCDKCKRPFPVDDVEAKNQKIAELNSTIKTLEDESARLAKEILEDESSKLKCKLGMGIVDYTLAKTTIETKLAKLNDDLPPYQILSVKLEAAHEALKTEISGVEASKKEISDILSENSHINERIALFNKFIDETKAELDRLLNTKNPFDELISEQNTKLASETTKSAKIKEMMDIYDVIKFVLSDEGFRAFIIKKVLGVLNSQLDYYLTKHESNAKVSFDEYFSDTIYNDRNVACSYENFSGGERKRIDLSTMFAFMDLRRIQGDVSYNLVGYDELLDSAISSRCAERLFEILDERLKKLKESSLIITHRKENLASDKITKIIRLEKVGGFTKVEK